MIAAVVLGVAGCNSGGPLRVEAPARNELDAGVRACGDRPAADPTLVVDGLSNSPGLFIEGPARVDESTTTRLSLTRLADPAMNADMRSLVIHGSPAPSLAVGRLIWLTYLVDPGDTFGLAWSPWTLTARDGKGGTLLFGTLQGHGTEPLAPFPIGELKALCTFDGCPRTYEQQVVVPGATPETIPNGGTATIPIGGRTYRLAVRAVTEIYAGCDAATYPPLPLPIGLSYVAEDLF